MSLAVLALLLATIVLAALTVKRVPEGTVVTLRRIDGHARRLQPGTHFVVPGLERVRHRISLGGHVLQLSTPGAQGRLYWQVLEPARADCIIERAEALLSQTAFEVLVAQRGADQAQLKATINQRLHDFGLLVTRLDLAAA